MFQYSSLSIFYILIMVSELQSVNGFILPLLELPLKLIKLASTFHGVWFLKAKSKEGKRLSAMVLQICVDTTVRVTVRALLFPSESHGNKSQKRGIQSKKKKLGSSNSICHWAIQIKAQMQKKSGNEKRLFPTSPFNDKSRGSSFISLHQCISSGML